MEHGLAFRDFFSGLAGEFGQHIDNSIPGYAGNRDAVARVIAALKPGGSTLDVGASEGQFGNTITKFAPLHNVLNIDPNPDMKRSHIGNERYETAAWVDGFHDGDEYIPAFRTSERFDFVHMSMVRQFVTADAVTWYSEAAGMLKPDGVFILNCKLAPAPGDEAGWREREALKDGYKLNFFTQEQIDAKAEETLVGMHQLMLTDEQEREALRASFRYVATYWESFNFRGYVASNCEASVRRFLQEY